MSHGKKTESAEDGPATRPSSFEAPFLVLASTLWGYLMVALIRIGWLRYK